jgi:hypothetical protein
LLISKATILAGHLELTGYEVMPGVKFGEGMDDKFLEKFDLVLSGHFHKKEFQRKCALHRHPISDDHCRHK